MIVFNNNNNNNNNNNTINTRIYIAPFLWAQWPKIISFSFPVVKNKQTRPRFLVLENFITCLSPIAFIKSVLKRVQRWWASWIRSICLAQMFLAKKFPELMSATHNSLDKSFHSSPLVNLNLDWPNVLYVWVSCVSRHTAMPLFWLPSVTSRSPVWNKCCPWISAKCTNVIFSFNKHLMTGLGRNS